MTDRWVSTKRKWCEYCRVYLTDSINAIRTHEGGKGHKDAVARKLSEMRKKQASDKTAKEKAISAMLEIEQKATKQYEKDLEASKAALESQREAAGDQEGPPTSKEWKLDQKSGYYRNDATNFYYDVATSQYYSQTEGQWMTRSEAEAVAARKTRPLPPLHAAASQEKRLYPSSSSSVPSSATITKTKLGVASGAVGKKAAPAAKPAAASKKPLSEAEAKALAAREAAKQRVLQRERGEYGGLF